MMTATGDDVQLVTFRAGPQDFGFDILQVERILRWAAPTELPNTPDFVEGMLPYEGSSLPVVDLRTRLGLTPDVRDETRIVVVAMGSDKVGVIVDEVLEVLRVDAGTITAPPAIFRGLAAEFLSGIATVGERVIVLLNSRRLFTSTERVALQGLST